VYEDGLIFRVYGTMYVPVVGLVVRGGGIARRFWVGSVGFQ